MANWMTKEGIWGAGARRNDAAAIETLLRPLPPVAG
jgi:hypothetical protein